MTSIHSGRTQLMLHAATCDEQDAWTDIMVTNWAWNDTAEDAQNVACYRELTDHGRTDVTVGYILH